MIVDFLYKKVWRVSLFSLISMSFTAHAGLFNAEVTLDGKKLTEAIDVVLENRINQFEQSAAKVLEKNQVSLANKANHMLNEMRIGPFYAVGTTLLIASINMYWQSLNDYLNITETDPVKLQALRKKVFGKIKAGLVFSVLGIGTLYKSHALAAACCGYTPQTAPSYIPMAEMYS